MKKGVVWYKLPVPTIRKRADQSFSEASLLRSEVLLGLALTIMLGALRFFARSCAGGLWRDEVHSVNMAEYPDILGTCWNDSFPVLFQLVLRAWILLLGSSDAALRGFGLACSCGLLGAIWWIGRQFGQRVPWALLVLVGLDPTFITYGGEVRGYGLGVLAYFIMLGCLWRYLEGPSPRGWWLLLACSLIAVQTSFTNAFLLFAAFCGGGFVALRRRDGRLLGRLVLIGVLAALSMLPYWLFVYPRAAEWAEIVKTPYSLPAQLHAFAQALSAAGTVRLCVWPLLGIVSALLAAICLWRRDGGELSHGNDLACFLLANLVIGTTAFWAYMHSLSVVTQVWYYLPLLALLAVTVDCASVLWASSIRRRLVFMAVLLITAVSMLPRTAEAIALRLTNVDLVAERLEQAASAGDLIVVFPWYIGLTFDRYYHGDAAWMPFPNVGNSQPRGHGGYLELKRHYMTRPTPECIAAELQRITTTLEKGRRVWLVNSLDFRLADERPAPLPPAPHPVFGWGEGFYEQAWSRYAAYTLKRHATSFRLVDVPVSTKVNPYENVPLLLIQGETAEKDAP